MYGSVMDEGGWGRHRINPGRNNSIQFQVNQVRPISGKSGLFPAKSNKLKCRNWLD